VKEKTYVEDIDRSIYDVKDEERDAYKVDEGLTEAIVEQISREKKDPPWMELFRLQALQIYNEMPVPDWGPSIEGLDMSHIVTYVPQDIKDTFERLGIPQAERKSLAGVGAQYDSELVYHNVREEVAAQGVVYTDMESALKGEYADMVQSHFMKLVKPNTNLPHCTEQSGQADRLSMCRRACR
jgi:Fe-S cluster assembly protein SufB